MFDIGWQELLLIVIVAVVVLGPKDIPVAVRTVVRMVRKMRAMAGEFQRSMDEVIREAELDEIRDEIRKASDVDVGKAIEKAVDPSGSIAREIDMSSLQADLDNAVRSPDVTQQPIPAPAPQIEQGQTAAPAEGSPAPVTETPAEPTAGTELPIGEPATGDAPKEDEDQPQRRSAG